VGSTNLNIASWFGNCELDAIIEDDEFGAEMEQMYLEDLANSSEIVLDGWKLRRPAEESAGRRGGAARGGGSGGRAAAGAMRIGHAIGAAITDRRVLGPVEARLATLAGLLLIGLAVLFVFVPGVLIYPVVVLSGWGGLAMLYRALRLARAKTKSPPAVRPPDAAKL
jgi:cardiolipin synthase